MQLLLDTHIFLWFIAGEPRLATRFRASIEDSGNQVYLSIASIWESVAKHRLGNLKLPGSPEVYLMQRCSSLGIDRLPIDDGSILELAKLPLIHRDPFDRIIIAQANQHRLKLVTDDPLMRQYPTDFL
jgi:PIN domain nuclease of toxin-antitoxin system